MSGFEHYLKSVYGERQKTIETQTEKVLKRHMKLGINTAKLGLNQDKETMIDPRMF